MYVIRPETRHVWKQVLTDEYAYDDKSAQQVVDFVAGEPDIAEAMPQTEEELRSIIKTVEETFDELRLSSFSETEASHHEIRDRLVEIVKEHLQVEQKRPATQSGGQAVAAFAAMDEEPPTYLQDFIDVMVQEIEDKDSPWERDDPEKIAQWVDARLEN